MMELCDLIPRRIHITVPAAYNPRKAGAERYRVHRHTLYETDLSYYEGVPTVTAARAIHQSIRDGEDPDQLRTAIRNAFGEGLPAEASHSASGGPAMTTAGTSGALPR